MSFSCSSSLSMSSLTVSPMVSFPMVFSPKIFLPTASSGFVTRSTDGMTPVAETLQTAWVQVSSLGAV